ncbi:MAG: GtrA family protein, partial [Candidatus Woesearchaeota archaeon]
QHDPRILKTMFEKSEQYDFVIGSRFVKGGSVESWSKHRIFFSKSAALLARPVLKSNLKDPMSGFFMLKKETFRAVKPYVLSRGYKILLDMLVSHTIHIQKPSFLEIPYSFRPRFLGTSKVSSKVIIEYMHMLLIFAFLRYKKLFLFLSVGAFGFLLNTTVLWSLTEIVGLFYVISGIIATILAIISNFMLNNCLTWSKIAKRHSFMKRFVLFFIISLGGLVISVSTLWFLTELGLYYLVSNAVGIIVATAWNYIINDRVTFS